MKNPVLSICIPTYNRERFLRECLMSIICDNELYEQFEVVVSDNASTDQTLQVLEEFKERLPLRWVVQDENLGPDRNFDAVIAAAQGRYCWLLGSDDVVGAGALPFLLEVLGQDRTDIIHFGYIQTDVALNHQFLVHPHQNFATAVSGGLADYFSAMPNLSLLFAFISSYIFRRSLWIDRRERLQRWIGTHYIQMLTMHAALAEGASVYAYEKCLVLARGGNPNEFNTLPGRFIALDAITVNRLIGEIYNDAPHMWRAIGQPFRRSYPVKALIYVAANGGLNYLIDVRHILERLGYPAMLLGVLCMLSKLKLLSAIKFILDVRRTFLTK